MDGRKALEIKDPNKIPVVQKRTSGGSLQGTETNGSLPVVWAWFASLVGPAVAAFCVALEPRPADCSPSP